MDVEQIRAIADGVRGEVRKAVIGQNDVIVLMLTSLLVGGHIWFGFFTAMTERRKDREGAQFLALHLPFMANVFGIGVLLLFGSGVLRLLVWGEPGLIFLPDPYGWLLFTKLVLYMLIVINGALIERRYLPF